MRKNRMRRTERREQIAFVGLLLLSAVLVLLAITPAPVHLAEPDKVIVAKVSELPVLMTDMSAEIPLTKTPEPTVTEPATPEQTETPEETAQVEEPAYTGMIHSYDWDGEDSEILLKIAMAEAEGESVEGKALVMLVVLNRAWSEQFPDSIEEVVFQKNQFSPTAPGGRYWTTEPDEGCYEALELVMSGWDESQGAMYFESTGRDGWHSRTLEFLFQYGGHKFYK